MRKILLVFIIGIFLISLISANLGTFKQGDCVVIRTILNSTWVNISTISSPSSTILVSNVAMTKSGQSFYYNFCSTNSIGIYTYDYFDNNGNVYVNDFEINKDGKAKTEQGDAIFYLGLIALILIGNYVIIYRKNRFVGSLFYLIIGLGVWTRVGQTEYEWIGTLIFIAGSISIVYDIINLAKGRATLRS